MPLKYPLDAAQLVALFNRAFEATDNTVLQGGADEPYYVPGQPSCIYFRADYARSALHEVAHWCVAGVRRRRFPDYGYWYSPDGRDAAQQAAFFAVEARPQAIEAAFCEACGVDFSPSVDNVGADIPAEQLIAFEMRIADWSKVFRDRGLPSRAARFLSGLELGGLSAASEPPSAGAGR